MGYRERSRWGWGHADEAWLPIDGTVTPLPWYRDERSPLYFGALRATKRVLDPRGILNPGVLV